MKLSELTAVQAMELTDLIICLPLVLLMNFALFQYLVTTFFRRRNEPLVGLLLFIAFLSFASLIPFGFPDTELVRDLNDISETCSVMTFLIQISILTRDINRKMKLRALKPMLRVSQLLIFVGIVVIVFNFIDIIAPVAAFSVLEHLDEALEATSLVFIVAFRFYFLAMAKGMKKVWELQKREMFYYFLFLTHEYPFMLLTHLTKLSWEHVQGVWMRVTIILCLWMTIKARLSSRNSKFGGKSTGHMMATASYHQGHGPSFGRASDASRAPEPVVGSRQGPNGTTAVPRGNRGSSVLPFSSSTLD